MKRRRRIFAIIGIMLILAGSCPAFAAGVTMFRDDYIEFDIPNNWIFDEYPIEREAFDKYELERVLYAYGDEDDTWMSLFYVSENLPDADGMYYMGSEANSLQYFDKYGKNLTEAVFTKYWDLEEVKISEPVYSSGEWENYIYVDVEYLEDGDQCENRVYLIANDYSASEMMVHTVMIFNPEYNALEDYVDEFWEIADGFDDYEYSRVVAGLETMDEDWVPGEESEGEDSILDMIFTVGVPVIIAIASIVVKVKYGDEDEENLEEESVEEPADKLAEKVLEAEARQAVRRAEKEKKKTERLDVAGKTENTKEKRLVFRRTVDDREILKERSAKLGQPRKDASGRVATPKSKTVYHQQAELRYIASLETLRKSGLLTKEEMQEMIDKHRRL